MTYVMPQPPSYPKYGEFQAHKNPAGQCATCDKPSIGLLKVQVTMFGRDDQYIPVCRDCRTLAREHTKQFMDQVNKRRQS